MELTLAPQSAGIYDVWNFRYQTGPRIIFVPSDGGSLKILGRRAVAVARRKPAQPGESTHGSFELTGCSTGRRALLLGWITGLAWRWSARTAALRHELRMKILDRFSSEEFVALLQTEGGRRWMADVLSGRSEPQELLNSQPPAGDRSHLHRPGGAGRRQGGESRFLLGSGILIVCGAAGLWAATWTVSRRRISRREPEAP